MKPRHEKGARDHKMAADKAQESDDIANIFSIFSSLQENMNAEQQKREVRIIRYATQDQ